MVDSSWQWIRHRFETLGVSCDILAGGRVAAMVDEQTPHAGYLAQHHPPLMLTVTYGPDATMDEMLQQALSYEAIEVSVVQDRHPTRFCGSAGERATVRVVPVPPVTGHRMGENGILEPMLSGPDEPILETIVTTVHRETPLAATFQRPEADAEAYEPLEMHFFNSFHCLGQEVNR